MKINKKQKGLYGELRAVRYLESLGYKIIERNYRNIFGEIDIVARDGETIVFVEVRRRDSRNYGTPIESIDMNKQKRIGRIACKYIVDKGFEGMSVRFDVVSIYMGHIEVIKDAFEYEGYLF